MRDDRDFLGLEFEWKCRGECGTDIDWLYELQTVEIINEVGPPLQMRAADRPFNLRPASDESFEWIKRRLRHCRENHEKCRKILDSRRKLKMPCRLIEVGPPGASTLYLREAKLPGMDKYAIASYVWGEKKSSAIADSKLKRRNLRSRMKKGMQLSKMPQTIRDVVTVTRQLGYSYLWIDALCIVQDDKDEMKREVGDMPQFYQRSDVTISAARAAHGGEGFLHPRDAAQAYGAVYEIPYQQSLPEGVTRATVILCENELRNGIEPGDTRIWTHQEKKLPVRKLIFGSRQTIWTCPERWDVHGGTRSQKSPEPEFTRPRHDGSEPAQVPSPGVELDWTMRDWMDEVCDYSNLEGGRSRELDRLQAFAETSKMLSAHVVWPTTQYCWGIWESEVIRLLLWSKDNPQIEDRCGPSWSWLSLLGPVTYPTSTLFCRAGDPRDYNLNVIHFPKAQDQDLRLRVRGSILEILRDGDGNTAKDVRNGGQLSISIKWDYNVAVQSVWLLEVISEYHRYKSYGLVLKNTHDDEFERCGFFELKLAELYQGNQLTWKESREHLWKDEAEILIA
ncbi:hypothetical protein TrVGV298_007579 [Trichoderma virens]|nr:hypothetical protein TrVGV298_007579 [Trichoderma virens]